MRLPAVAGALGLAASLAAAIPTISTKGSKFFTSEGDQWFIKGIAYQLVPDDPLIDNDQCQRDASLMQELGANAIRVYHVDPSVNHDSCMSTFEEAGIYLFLDLDTFDTQIEQNSPHWNESQVERFSAVMDAFHTYDNLAGFFVGNEVITMSNGSASAVFIKAAIRDMKAYRDSQNYRQIPIGYSAADISSIRPMLQNYLACGSNASEALDFFALNAYEWCGNTTYRESGYSHLTQMLIDIDYPLPIFFSETGCNTVRPRTFADQAAILGPEMTPYWSGALVYEWIQEMNNYGLISYGPRVDATASGAPPDGFTRSGTPTPVLPDFTNLQSQWATLSPEGVRVDQYSPTLTPPPCPEATPGQWEVDGDVALPTVGQVLDAAGRSSIGGVTGAATQAGASPTGAAVRREVKGGMAGLVGVAAGMVALM
ncbi:hypothetical protein H2201_007922 [Coniosporium apollinis]|uniref:1,3-beta-glucanosyltransferase n=2 Tax=Coniosporium TaxID=2810619 RepID=A0ABQ9NMS9_9PEZI|nr:hypothetical protein H2199_004228 [Cladosporium sp. JES 115]KAJ9658027.1 hypothetical protein H2201_007922 [Coniosporium apollinis]